MTEDISPQVKILESNFKNSNINATLNVAMYIGEFERGPINEPVAITSELQFKQIFGRALDFNYNHWYQVYNYLQYPGNPIIWVCRTAGSGSIYASNNGNIASTTGEWGNLLTVEIYDKLDYIDSKYLQDIFGYYSDIEISKDYIVIIKRKDVIVEKFNISNSTDLPSQYISTINLERGIFKLSGGLTIPATYDDYKESYNLFSKENYEIDIVISAEEANDIAIDFVETRKDCVAFLNIPRAFVTFLMINEKLLLTEDNRLVAVNEYKLKNKLTEEDYINIKNYIKSLRKSSYTFITFGFKNQLDNFTGKNRLISISGDIAGLKAAASTINPWSIGAGLERGVIKNYNYLNMKVNPSNYTELYKLGVNSVQNGILMSQKMFVDETFNVSRMHSRNIYNYIERKSEKILNRYIFELNDLRLRGTLATELKNLLSEMIDSRGIEAGKVIVSKNSENNIIINIYIKMINIAEIIRLNMVNTGVNSVNLTSEIQIKEL